MLKLTYTTPRGKDFEAIFETHLAMLEFIHTQRKIYGNDNVTGTFVPYEHPIIYKSGNDFDFSDDVDFADEWFRE